MDAQRKIWNLIEEYKRAGNYQGWFEALYAAADGDGSLIPWAYMRPHPQFTDWARDLKGEGKRALVVGCGLGDDADELARLGFRVTAFDLSEVAIAWCKQRFPESGVDFRAMDLFKAPPEWRAAFDFVLEINTTQALPLAMRADTIASIAGFVAPGGTLLLICDGRDNAEDIPGPPWPLSPDDVALFTRYGLKQIRFETLHGQFRVEFRAA